MTTPPLQVKDLHAGYESDIEILGGVSIELRDKGLTSIIGANGSGKSTLVKCIFGMLEPWQGSVYLGGEPVTALPPRELLGRGVAFVPQYGSVFPTLSVDDNLGLAGRILLGRDRTALRERLEAVYTRLPALRDRRSADAGSLSGGQQKLVEIGRALMVEPSLLLLDEPTAGLAPKMADQIYGQISGFRDAGMTILMVDQNVPKALELSDWVYQLDLGKVHKEGRGEDFADYGKSFWSEPEIRSHPESEAP